ncbi:MFS transporter [Sphaerisporangium album]|uniref:MFS transporter n=1 Tax=Sphaerisporangium album TaxID=509200 RepID=A0A367FAK0_9ACTN|nr:MFS transporter [Sphaerisporangium album]RCG26892.1 MFS transporter [Sphaerisporangium album]
MTWRERLVDLRPLRASRPFRDLWIGSSLAGIGAQIASVAVLLQVWELTRSPVWTGGIGLATALPMLVFGLAGGALADVVDRRTIVRVTTAGHVLMAAALVAQAAAGNRSVVLLLVLVAAQSGCAALGAPARRTFPVRLLPPEQVTAGLALHNIAFQTSMLVGPALAGIVLAQWRYPAAYAIQAVADIASLIAVIRLPSMPAVDSDDDRRPAHRGREKGRFEDARPGEGPPEDGRPGKDPRRRRGPAPGGWRIIVRRPVLWGAFATDLAATVLAMPVALFPLINEIRFGGGPQTLGLFLSAIAVGGLGAGLLSGTVTRLRHSGRVQLVAATTWGLALAGFGLAGPLWLALGCLTVAGAADTIAVVTRGGMVQLETPDRYRGRVSSVEHVIGLAGPEIGNFRGGLLASLTSAPVALLIGGLSAAFTVITVGLLNRPLRDHRLPSPQSFRPQGRAPTGPGSDTNAGTWANTPAAAGGRPRPPTGKG